MTRSSPSVWNLTVDSYNDHQQSKVSKLLDVSPFSHKTQCFTNTSVGNQQIHSFSDIDFIVHNDTGGSAEAKSAYSRSRFVSQLRELVRQMRSQFDLPSDRGDVPTIAPAKVGT